MLALQALADNAKLTSMNSQENLKPPQAGGLELNDGLNSPDNGWNALDRYRAEMINHQQRLAKLAADFLKLGAFEDAAQCAIKTAGLTHVIGRIPKRPDTI